MQLELELMPQHTNFEYEEKETPICFIKQAERVDEIKAHAATFDEPQIENIKENYFAPELLPAITTPTEIQELR